MFQADAAVLVRGRVFPGEPCQVGDARRWAAALLSQAGADADIAELLTSELFTNAILHTRSGAPRGTVTVIVTAAGAVHVHDLGPGGPGPCPGPDGWVPGEGREDFGNGLPLVTELSGELVHGPAAACPMAWPGDPARERGCCTWCVPAALGTALPAPAMSRARQPQPAAA
jgi:serine/threonine-protein kinase RsbW